MVGDSSTSSSLKEYLKKYTSNDDEKKKKMKKKKKKTSKPDASGVLVVDEDPIWQKPVQLDEEEEDSADEERPQVEEDIEVKRMKRLEQLKLKRPFGAISEDGSGWVSVSNSQSTLKSEDQNSDISPPRKTTHRNDIPLAKPEQQSEIPFDPDLSPPRKSRMHHRDPSPVAETKSSRFPGARAARFDTPSPDPHREASRQDADLSPPRRKQRESPPPKSRKHQQYASPVAETKSSRFPGARTARFDTPSPEPHLKASEYDADLSPPRRKQRESSERISSTRQSVHNAGRHHASDRAASVSDISPPRKRQKEAEVFVHQPKTGLVSGRDIKDEIDKKKKEDWLRFKEMDPSVSGRDAEAVYRNKMTGERMSKDEFLESQKKLKKKDEKPKEIKLEWGKGLAQKREVEERLKELEAEKDKPFARTRDDPDLDAMLKERVRWGDPMAHLVKKKNLDPILPDLSENERMKESGFIIPQDIPSHSWIKRGVDAPPNRYGIRPGRHWDGVDRSNGFEKEMFKRTNEKSAMEREAYLWSVSDM